MYSSSITLYGTKTNGLWFKYILFNKNYMQVSCLNAYKFDFYYNLLNKKKNNKLLQTVIGKKNFCAWNRKYMFMAETMWQTNIFAHKLRTHHYKKLTGVAAVATTVPNVVPEIRKNRNDDDPWVEIKALYELPAAA